MNAYSLFKVFPSSVHFDSNGISLDDFSSIGTQIVKTDNLVVSGNQGDDLGVALIWGGVLIIDPFQRLEISMVNFDVLFPVLFYTILFR